PAPNGASIAPVAARSPQTLRKSFIDEPPMSGRQDTPIRRRGVPKRSSRPPRPLPVPATVLRLAVTARHRVRPIVLMDPQAVYRPGPPPPGGVAGAPRHCRTNLKENPVFCEQPI